MFRRQSHITVPTSCNTKYMRVNVYVISMPGSPRRPVISSHLAANSIPFTFWDGVLVPADAEGRRQLIRDAGGDPDGVTLVDGTLGCLLAHVGLWRHLADGANTEVAMVLEDDVMCNSAVDFRSLDVDALMKNHDYCFLHMYPCRPTGAQAQLITPAAARLLTLNASAILAKNSPVDLMVWMNLPKSVSLRIGDAYRGGHGAWLFRHASNYDDVSHSERMQINLERNRCTTDYAN